MARQIQITVNVTINDEDVDDVFLNRLEQDMMWDIDSAVNKIARAKNLNATHGVTLVDRLEV